MAPKLTSATMRAWLDGEPQLTNATVLSPCVLDYANGGRHLAVLVRDANGVCSALYYDKTANRFATVALTDGQIVIA